MSPSLYGMTVYFVVYGYFEMLVFFLVLMILLTSLCVEKNPNAGAAIMLPNSNASHAIIAVIRADKGQCCTICFNGFQLAQGVHIGCKPNHKAHVHCAQQWQAGALPCPTC